jgi:GNAT superfamily N-acetyltransferase
MRREEMQIAVDWAAGEGWNPGLHDAHCFYAADPEGFLVAEMDGKPVGCISAVSYDGRFGFIGLYIVVPEWRRRGIGHALWRAAMTRLSGHVIGLDGVPRQQANYRSSGFSWAWSNVRFAGTAMQIGTRAAQIAPIATVDFRALCRDDRRVFPASREAFLRWWIAMREATGLAWLEQGRLAGWGLIRRCREGHKIGPLMADTPAIADGLYAALCASVPLGSRVFLDVPTPNAEAVVLAKTYAMHCVFETARMYLGTPPECELQRLYGITSFELG